MDITPDRPILVKLASPRGFCAGVERAIITVEQTLADYGPPVYVRHEIVHNRHVVERLAAMGAVFIEDLDDAPNDRPVIFSAHGAPKAAHDEAKQRQLIAIDATCPLVLKVHSETRRHVGNGRHVFLIGHRGHPEVIGTMGQAKDGEITLIESVEAVSELSEISSPSAYVTQTTLSVDDAAAIIAALKRKVPSIMGPRKEDICYATSNRQTAVKAVAPGTDLFIVIGSKSSSNSVRLVEVAIAAGAKKAVLIEDAAEFDFNLLSSVSTVGLSAGASAPEHLVESFLSAITENRKIRIETIKTAEEKIVFNPPMRLAS